MKFFTISIKDQDVANDRHFTLERKEAMARFILAIVDHDFTEITIRRGGSDDR